MHLYDKLHSGRNDLANNPRISRKPNRLDSEDEIRIRITRELRRHSTTVMTRSEFDESLEEIGRHLSRLLELGWPVTSKTNKILGLRPYRQGQRKIHHKCHRKLPQVFQGSSTQKEIGEQPGVALLRMSSIPNEARISSSNGHNREAFYGKTKSKRSYCDQSLRYSSASNSSDESSAQFTNSGYRSPGEFSNGNESNSLPEVHSELPRVTETPCRSILDRTDICCKGEKGIECEEIGDGIRCRLPSSRGHGTVTVELKKGSKDPTPCSGTMLQFRIRGRGKPQHKSEADKAIQAPNPANDYPKEVQRDFMREDANGAAKRVHLDAREQSSEFLWEPAGEKRSKPRPKPRFQHVVGISTCGKRNHPHVSSPAKTLRSRQERNKKQGKIDWCDPIVGGTGYEQGITHQVRGKHRREGQTADLDDNLLETLEHMFDEMSEYEGLTQPDKKRNYTVERTMRPVSPDTMKIIKEVEKMDVLDSISTRELDRELRRELNNPSTITIPVQDDRKPPVDLAPKLTSQPVDPTNTWQPTQGPPQQASPYQSTQLSPHQLVQQPPNPYVNTQLAVGDLQSQPIPNYPTFPYNPSSYCPVQNGQLQPQSSVLPPSIPAQPPSTIPVALAPPLLALPPATLALSPPTLALATPAQAAQQPIITDNWISPSVACVPSVNVVHSPAYTPSLLMHHSHPISPMCTNFVLPSVNHPVLHSTVVMNNGMHLTRLRPF